MENIIKILKDRNISTNIKYYGTGDMATGFEIKNIINNYELYNEILDSISPAIKDIDDYINYLYLKCLKKYREAIPIVRDDIKDNIENIVLKVEKIYERYKEEDLARFISKNYKKILTNEYKELYIKHDVIDYTIEYMCKYCNKDNKAIEYIIQNYSYIVYDNFESFKKVFDDSKKLYYYDLLLTEEKLKKDSSFRLEEISYVLNHLKRKNEEKYKEKAGILIELYRRETFNATTDDVMNKHFNLRDIIKVLSELKHPKCYEFEKEYDKQKELLDEYILKNGHEQVYSIDIRPIVEIMEKKDVEWYIKALSMTHLKKQKKLVCLFEDIMKNAGKKGIVDYVSTNVGTDDTFTYSLINTLSIALLHGKYVMNYMISDNSRLNDLLAYIIMGLDHYFKDDSMYFDREQIELDINMIFDALKELNEAYDNKNEIRIKRIIYGLEVQLCGIIEKILRIVYRDINKEQEYISFDSVTLKSLLNQPTIQKELGRGTCQCIQYLLSKRDGNIGKNTRNNFTHYNDKIYGNLNLDTILETIYILLIISNTLLCKKK